MKLRAPTRYFSPADQRAFARLYPDTPTEEVARRFRITVGEAYYVAAQIGVHKSAAYMARERPGQFRDGENSGRVHRFPKGHVPANKGLRRPGWAPGRMRETQFRKGSRPHTWKPVGSYRINADGYLDRKVTDTGYPPRDWVAVHRLVWIAEHGQIPAGYRVCFKLGRRTTELAKITVDALELLTARECMARNSMYRYPREIVDAIRARALLVRSINKRIRKCATE